MSIIKNRLAVPNSLNINSLLKGISDTNDIIYASDLECANLLFNKKVDIALIPILEYASNIYVKNYRIIPEFCISRSEKNIDSYLIFSPKAKNILSVAHRPGVVSELLIIKIIFRENYNIDLSFTESDEELGSLLSHTDAVLVSNKEAIESLATYNSIFNIFEEWFELTGLPFVSHLWVTIEDVLQTEEIVLFMNSFEVNLKKYFLDHHQDQDKFNKSVDSNYGSSFALNAPQVESINEIFRYAFFYGILTDIPDLKYCRV